MLLVNAIKVNIFKSSLGDCSNGGISSKYDDILLECKDGHIKVDVDNPPENFCFMDHLMDYKYIRPFADPDEIGWMAGGSLIYSSDYRFRNMSEYPLILHDRQETKKGKRT